MPVAPTGGERPQASASRGAATVATTSEIEPRTTSSEARMERF
jgi:hypothetical protein